MILEIGLEKFQAYLKAVIKPVQVGITAITGPSNAGKSSIIRGIELVRKNRPAGNAYIKNGFDSCVARINDIRRIKKKTVNAYQIGRGKPHKALKGAVPEEVKTALNLGDVNIQTQHNAMFLINETPGKVAQQLAQLVDLSIVQRVLHNVGVKKKRVKAEITATEINIEKYTEILAGISFVNDADKALSKIERKQGKIDEADKKLFALRGAVGIAKQRQAELSKLPDISALKPAIELRNQWRAANEEEWDLKQLTKLIRRVNKAKAQKVFAERWIKYRQRAEELNAMEAGIRRITDLCRICNSASAEIVNKQAAHTVLNEQYTKTLGDKCPTCGAEIKK